MKLSVSRMYVPPRTRPSWSSLLCSQCLKLCLVLCSRAMMFAEWMNEWKRFTEFFTKSLTWRSAGDFFCALYIFSVFWVAFKMFTFTETDALLETYGNAFCWWERGSPECFSDCVNWFNSFWKPLDSQYLKIKKGSFLVPINPAWVFMLRKKKKT